MRIAGLLLQLFYSALFYALLPFVACRLLWRSLKAPAYRQRWAERFGFYHKTHVKNVLWIHAVSVGEAEAVFPLVKFIQTKHPELPILITTTTPTGSGRVKAVLKDSVAHVYLPYDVPLAVNRFMDCFQPRMAVIMETELWPNLFKACGNRNIPLFVINARLSGKSARRYQKISALVKPTLAQVNSIITQSEQDAQRFLQIGAESRQVTTLGNMKFDLDIPQTLVNQGLEIKAKQFDKRFVWLIASTHTDEEAIFLTSYAILKKTIPELLLVLVPRHPERFADVKKLCLQQQLQVLSRTSGDAATADTDVFLLDTLGELKTYYAAADVAFVGGSMVPVGGHNILEAAAVGVPVLFGPYMANFRAIADSVLSAEAALQCHNQADLVAAIILLHQNPAYRSALAEKGKAFIDKNKGVISKVYTLLAPHFTPASSSL